MISRFLSRNYLRVSQISFNRYFSNTSDDFLKAKDNVTKLKDDPGSMAKLKLYALFKQATEGKNTKPKPSMINIVGVAKWDAWSQLGEMTKDEAMGEYIKYVDGLIKEIGLEGESKNEVDESTTNEVEGLKITKNNGVLKILLNRPGKKNAITWDMYEAWSNALNESANDKTIKCALITGAGDYFCSGNDLSNFTKFKPGETKEQVAERGKKILLKFVGSFIDFPKPIIAAVNGPAIGICVTTMALYDAVYASDNATFSVPFTNLGQTPEGCSSYTFPLLFGSIKASNMLIFNQPISASQAGGLVTEVIPHKVFMEEVTKKVNYIADLPPQSVMYAKALIRDQVKAKLHEVNIIECDRLAERWLSDECINAITKFLTRKN